MTNIQISQIETLSDAELDSVAGGFNFGIFKTQVHFLGNLAHHPIDNAGSILGVFKGMANNALGNLDHFPG